MFVREGFIFYGFEKCYGYSNLIFSLKSLSYLFFNFLDFSSTFQEIVQKMADYFDLEIYATRLNFYPGIPKWEKWDAKKGKTKES